MHINSSHNKYKYAQCYNYQDCDFLKQRGGKVGNMDLF
jgi:hypothetical protein